MHPQRTSCVVFHTTKGTCEGRDSLFWSELNGHTAHAGGRGAGLAACGVLVVDTTASGEEELEQLLQGAVPPAGAAPFRSSRFSSRSLARHTAYKDK